MIRLRYAWALPIDRKVSSELRDSRLLMAFRETVSLGLLLIPAAGKLRFRVVSRLPLPPLDVTYTRAVIQRFSISPLEAHIIISAAAVH
jgi:hypothetical protein